MIKKQNYVAPAAECLSVKFERNFLDSENGLEDGSGVNFGTSNRNDYHGW